MLWFLYFVFAFLVSLLASGLIIMLGKTKAAAWWKRLGGVAVIGSFLVAILCTPEIVITPQIRAVMIGLVAILFFGLWDDMKDVSWRKQLILQLLLGLLLIWSGYQINYISNPFGEMVRFDTWLVAVGGAPVSILGSALILVWLIGVMNSLNWADGINGLAGGLGILGGLAIFLVSLRPEVNQPAIAIMALMLIGSVLGFWWFNYPGGRIEAGTSGSYGIAFVLAALAIIAGTKIATTLIIFALPVIDALWVVYERYREGRSIVKKDVKSRHLHYRLRNLGWSDTGILSFYLGFLALMMAISLLIESRLYKGTLLGFELVTAGLIVYLASMLSSRKEQLSIKKR